MLAQRGPGGAVERDGLEQGQRPGDALEAEGRDGGLDDEVGVGVQGGGDEQGRDVEAEREVGGGDVTASHLGEGRACPGADGVAVRALQEDGAGGDGAVGDAAVLEGGEEGPHGGEVGGGEGSGACDRGAGRALPHGGDRVLADVDGPQGAGGGDPGVVQGEPHEGGVLDLAAEGERRGPGPAGAQGQQPEGAS